VVGLDRVLPARALLGSGGSQGHPDVGLATGRERS